MNHKEHRKDTEAELVKLRAYLLKPGLTVEEIKIINKEIKNHKFTLTYIDKKEFLNRIYGEES